MVDNVLVAAVVAVVAVGIIAGASRAPLPLKKDRSRVGWTHGIVPCCNVQRPSRPQKHSQQRFSLSLSLSLSLSFCHLSAIIAGNGHWRIWFRHCLRAKIGRFAIGFGLASL